MSALPDPQLIQDLSVELGVDPSFIEKDFYATRLIEILGQLKYPSVDFVFSGGTCLSKAHKLIQRFSEDVDFKIIPKRNLTKAEKKAIREDVLNVVRNQNEWSLIEDSIEKADGSNYFGCLIQYERRFNVSEALRPELKLEAVFSVLTFPAEQKPISSLLNEALRIPSVCSVLCVNPLETAADKLSALVWRMITRSTSISDYDPATIRHLHDLAALKDSAILSTDFAPLARLTIESDLKDRAQLPMNACDALHQVITALETRNEYAREYQQYVDAMSYADDDKRITFGRALDALKVIATSICS